MRGATFSMTGLDGNILEFQSTRPMRGATPAPKLVLCGGDISIHAPHAGRDILTTVSATEISTFQSTRPMRGATIITHTPKRPRIYFNPRAPCGARPAFSAAAFSDRNFNPRAPCGARPGNKIVPVSATVFQSTRPMRGATRGRWTNTPRTAAFQSTRPMRGATWDVEQTFIDAIFQSTRPMRGATSYK